MSRVDGLTCIAAQRTTCNPVGTVLWTRRASNENTSINLLHFYQGVNVFLCLYYGNKPTVAKKM